MGNACFRPPGAAAPASPSSTSSSKAASPSSVSVSAKSPPSPSAKSSGSGSGKVTGAGSRASAAVGEKAYGSKASNRSAGSSSRGASRGGSPRRRASPSKKRGGAGGSKGSRKGQASSARSEPGAPSAKGKAASNYTKGSVARYGVAEDRNAPHRRTMEDKHTAIVGLDDDATASFFGVYDGHQGRQASEYCEQHLHKVFLSKLKEAQGAAGAKMKAIWTDAYATTDANMKADGVEYAGTTVVTAFVRREGGSRHLYIANAGDARAVLARSGKAIQMTYDHKVTDEAEAKRITDAGGMIMNGRVLGQIALARSLGDHLMKDYIISEPYCKDIKLNKEDQFLILACDGVWDEVSSQEAVDLLVNDDYANPEAMAKKLLTHAIEKGSDDNITVMIVILSLKPTS